MHPRISFGILCFALLFCGSSSQDGSQNYIEALVEFILSSTDAASLNGQTLDNNTLISILNNMSQDGAHPDYGLLYNALVRRIETMYSSNAVNVTSCGVGSFINASNGACTPCPAGYWSETSLASSFSACQPCAAGTYSSVVGASNRTTCLACPEGRFSAAVAATSELTCQRCGSGSTSVSGAQGSAGCQCLDGYYGHYQDGASCQPCQPGFFCSGGASQPCPGQAEGKSTSPALSSVISQCYCRPGYFGYAYDESSGGCQLCGPNKYCNGNQGPNNEGMQYNCPSNSNSPAGSTDIEQCVCASSFRKQYVAHAQRPYSITASPCACTNAGSPKTCASVDVVGCATCLSGLHCAANQTLTCKQGYLGLSPPASGGLTSGTAPAGVTYWWKIAPPGAETIVLSFSKFTANSAANQLRIQSCSNVNCTLPTSVTTLSNNLAIDNSPHRVSVDRPVLLLTWTSTSNVQSPFFLEYTTVITCSRTAIALTAGVVYYYDSGEVDNSPPQPDPSWPLVVWVGDTVRFSYPTTSRIPMELRAGSVSGDVPSDLSFGLTSSDWQPIAVGNFWLVDLEFPSRVRQIQVLPVDSRRVMVWYDVASGSFTLSGDASGSGSPDIVLVVRDVLSLSRLSSTSGVVIFSSYTNSTVYTLLGGAGLVGQGAVGSGVLETSLTWDTRSYASGVYYYGSTTSLGSVAVGKIVLYPASGGASCAACQEGEYCFNGTTMRCPANSMSGFGKTEVSDCLCVAGYARSTTDLEAYVNSQAVDCGGRHSCVVAQNGSLWCWGANDGGQLGIGSAGSSQATPRIVPGLSGVTQVALGDNFTCAVYLSGSENRVKCWGNNRWGQLGLDSNADQQFSPGADARLGIGTGAYSTVALSCAGSSCCAVVVKSGGKALTCWGKNDRYQLGHSTSNKNIGTATSSSVNERYSFAATGTALSVGSREISLVSMAVDHACAVDTLGSVLCWGINNNGVLGRGIAEARTEGLDPSATVDLGGGAAKTVNCFNYVCCVVMQRTFEVKCWGRGLGGRLGVGVFDVGTTASSMGLNLQSVDLGVNTLAMDVNVGGVQTCVLLSNNYVKCWGRVLGADIGDNPPADMMDMLPNFDLAGGRVALQIAGKGSTTCAVTSDYSVVCWGDNTHRQLGAATNVTASNMTLVAMPAGVTALRSSGTPTSAMCVGCEPNTYCDGGGGLAQSCPDNTYSPMRSQSLDSCKCLPGYKEVTGDGGKSCVLCSGTEYCLLGQAYNCDDYSSTMSPGSSDRSACQCAVGYYKHATLGCQACAQGLYKDAVGNAASCSQCPAGTRSNATGLGNSSGCARCEAGTSSIAGSAVCVGCGKGTAAAAGSGSCTACGAGFFADDLAGACTPCRAGTYDEYPQNGLPDTCTPCSPGTASGALNVTSSSACAFCRAGTFSGSGAANCSLCSPGQYSGEGSQSCTSCPGNSTSAAGSNYSQCKCLAGFFKRFEGDGTTFTCQPCRGGEHAEFDKVGACNQCPAGTASAALLAVNASVCSTCRAGTAAAAGSAVCQPCAATYFSSADGASACTPCALGFWSASGSSSCTGCAAGSYAEGPISSASQCLTCPRGSICVGASNAASSTPPVPLRQECPLGTFQNSTGRSLMTQCSPCDANHFCPAPTLKAPCPPGTKSNSSSTSQLQCTCETGYTCNYQKVLNALVTLLMTRQQWDDNSDVRTAFLNAVAAAAKTTADKVRIVSVTQVGAAGGSRRLFGVAGSHVLMEILDGEGLGIDTELDGLLGASGLEIEAERAWIAPHRVDAVRLPAGV